MAETAKTIRVSPEAMDAFRKIAKENFESQDEALQALVKLYDLDMVANTEYGNRMKLDINAFRRHTDELLALYTASITRGSEAMDAAESKLRNRIESSETAVTTLKAQNEQIVQEFKKASVRIADLENQIAAKDKALAEAQAETEKAEKSAGAWEASINTLTGQLDDYKRKSDEYDKMVERLNLEKEELIDKLNKMTGELAKAQAQAEAYKEILSKYAPEKSE